MLGVMTSICGCSLLVSAGMIRDSERLVFPRGMDRCVHFSRHCWVLTLYSGERHQLSKHREAEQYVRFALVRSG